MTDPSHTLSATPDEGDPADSRTTTPEHVSAAESQPLPQSEPVQSEPQQSEPVQEPQSTQPREAEEAQVPRDQAPQPPEAADTSSGAVDGGRTTSASRVIPPAPAAVLGFPEGEPQALHPAHLKAQLIAHWIAIGVMSIAALTVLSGLALGGQLRGVRAVLLPGLAVSLIGLIAWWGRHYNHLDHRRTSFVISAAGCEIRRGVLTRRIITVPLSRIQHTDVTQGPLQRAYGLGTLTLYTAGTEHAKVDLSGLAFETAMAIRQWLFDRSELHDR